MSHNPNAVICPVHGQVFLTVEEYSIQMGLYDQLWSCPICGNFAEWDDDNYDEYWEE